MNTCTIENCNKRHEAKGYCIKHYERLRTHGNPLKSLHKKYCEIGVCKQKHVAYGYCRKHYERFLKGTLDIKSIYEMTDKERLLSKIIINKNTECWEWQGCKIKDNYGMIMFKGKQHLAHRLSFEIHFGEFDKDLCVCHKCDNPSCINPQHLFLGNHQQNMDDMKNKGRRYSLLKKGNQHE